MCLDPSSRPFACLRGSSWWSVADSNRGPAVVLADLHGGRARRAPLVLPVGVEPTPRASTVGRGEVRFPTEFHRRELPPPRPCGAFRCFCEPYGLAQAPHLSCALP